MLCWYVATVHSFCEALVAEQLRTRGIRCFAPKVISRRVLRGNVQNIERPYMPGYVFPQFDVEDDEWRTIPTTRGVVRLLSSGPETPSRIRQGAMDALLRQCDDNDVVQEAAADRALAQMIPVGSLVRVTAGPFQGFEGPVKLSTSERIKVLLGKVSIPVELKPKDVKMIKNSGISI